MAFEEQYGVGYTIWRPFNIITPYEKSEDEAGISHVFADFLRKILYEKQNPMEIFGDGEQIRCFTWIDEVAGAIAAQSFADTTRNEAYNLANPEPVTMKELARRIFAKGKQRGIVEGDELAFDHVPIYDDDVKERIPAVEKATDDFGWDPQVKLDDSLERCIDNMDRIYDDL
jgi:nucleoside-diphosphate-sugar epimerase